MEHALRTALIDWLRSGPAPLDTLNAVEEEAPVRVSLPWLGIAASASADWSTKDAMGREIRVALELASRGDDIPADGALVGAIDRRVDDLPRLHDGIHIANITFLRARTERRAKNTRSTLLEYRFRCLEV
ncbi:DUF3168 domain-containing protein [Parerythrobacter lacustris]|uniref:DUF3168 domain-containing protein n=1 Tax=Parerythrobacter lacustris TaxID=2969984 RepID=A0ABT1XRI1_9SPHN|nr:DUF3168 domain-containing protein [Parerythrobacter lacustris]MCR2834259.1 DUF3168 domain-containing protein [Parerythrobacter lacustris]